MHLLPSELEGSTSQNKSVQLFTFIHISDCSIFSAGSVNWRLNNQSWLYQCIPTFSYLETKYR